MFKSLVRKTYLSVKKVTRPFFNVVLASSNALYQIIFNFFVLIIKLPGIFTKTAYFFLIRQFKTYRARVFWRTFKPALLTKKNAKKILKVGKYVLYVSGLIFAVIWVYKTGNFNENFYKFNIKLMFELNTFLVKFKNDFFKYSITVINVDTYPIPYNLRNCKTLVYYYNFFLHSHFLNICRIFILFKFIVLTTVFIIINLLWFLTHCLNNFIVNSFFLILDFYADVIIGGFVDLIIFIFLKIVFFISDYKNNIFIYILINIINILIFLINFIKNDLVVFLNQIIYTFYLILIKNINISFNDNPIYIIILNIIVIILFILIGGVIPLIERKYLSLIQRRVGPKFVGYNGRLQFIADALKLLFKEIIFLINTNRVSFVLLPILLLNLNIFLLINLVWLNNLSYIDNEYLILLILLIELITTICTSYIGFLVKNKYTIIASTRILNGIVVFEIFLITLYFYLYILNSKLSLDNVYFNQIFNIKLKINLIILPPIVYAVLLNLKKVPFDIIEAETELIMGFTTEHSGFLGAALLLIEYLHLFLWSFLIITLFII